MVEKRFARIRNILWVILILNWFVALSKIVYGYISKTNSMTADGFHSFSDGTSNIIGIVGVLLAAQPADEDHPYGHKKYETFASITISILLFLISFNLVRSAVIRFTNPVTPSVTIISFIVMVVTIAVNLLVFSYERKKGEELSSDILRADAEHTRSDILVSVSVICSLIAIKLGFPVVDTTASFIIAILIAKSGLEILRTSSYALCDRAAIVSDKIKNMVMSIKGVRECHEIRTRGRPDDVHIDLHVLVDPSMHVDTAHSITEDIERKIKKSVEGVTDVIVHIEPLSR